MNVEDQLEAESTRPIGSVPRPWRAFGWFLVMFVLFYGTGFFYGFGYGVYRGVTMAMSGELMQISQQEFTRQLQRELMSPMSISIMTFLQAIIFLPLVYWLSNFPVQDWKETLAIKSIDPAPLLKGIGLLVVFFGGNILVSHYFEPGDVEFLEAIVNSHHHVLAVALVVVAPIVEESIFRGYLFKAWKWSRLGVWGTILLTSVLFSLMHLGQYGFYQVVVLFVLGLILGLSREWSGSLVGPVILHGLNNFVFALEIIYLGGFS